MSCIRFVGGKPVNGGDPVAQFLKPEMSESKLNRLRKMATDRRAKIRESAALHPNLPADCFFVLARDKQASVRTCLVRNVNASESILRLLSADSDSQVRAWVAVADGCPNDILDTLIFDLDENVQMVARSMKAAILFE